MKATNLLLAGAVMVASVPVFAANDEAGAAAQAQQPTKVHVALNTAPAGHVSHSLTDRTARKYPKAQKSEIKPEKLVHERWVHDEDHQY